MTTIKVCSIDVKQDEPAKIIDFNLAIKQNNAVKEVKKIIEKKK